MTPFRGLCAFPITPADSDGRTRPAELRRLLRPAVDAGVDSVCVLSSTGSYAYLDPDQRRMAAEASLAEIGGQVPVIINAGAMRTNVAQSLARHAEDTGADGLLIAHMSYTPLTEDEVFAHYAAVAGSSGLPICIYNNPTTTHFSFTVDLLVRLSGIPQIRAVKMPLPTTGDFRGEIAGLRACLPEGFSIGYSADWGCADALLAGADAFHSVAAGTWPAEMLRFFRAAQAGDVSEAARMNTAFQPMWALFRKYGSLGVVRQAANLMGRTDAEPPRPILSRQGQDAARHQAMNALMAV